MPVHGGLLATSDATTTTTTDITGEEGAGGSSVNPGVVGPPAASSSSSSSSASCSGGGGAIKIPANRTTANSNKNSCQSGTILAPLVSSASSVATRAPTLDRLVFLTFNAGLLEYRLCGVTLYQNPPFTWKRLYQIPNALKSAAADIVALQEVYDEAQADYLIESLRHSYPFVGRRTSGGAFAVHNGLLLLSRFPIISTHFHSFSQVSTLERFFGSKGVLECIVDVPTMGRLCLLNVHLSSGSIDPESKSLDAVREKEILQVLSLADLAAFRQETPLILGDLNASPKICPSTYRQLTAHGWIDAFVEAQKFDWASADPSKLNILHNNTEGACRSKCTTSFGAKALRKVLRTLSNTAGTLTDPSVTHVFHNKAAGTLLSSVVNKMDMASTPRTLLAGRRRHGSVIVNEQRGSICSPSTAGADDGLLLYSQQALCPDTTMGNGGNAATTGADSRTEESESSDEPEDELECTWDVNNPLNQYGVHAGCHRLRCDHIFLPPYHNQGPLQRLLVQDAEILFREPRVTVKSAWLGVLCGANSGGSGGSPFCDEGGLMVTISDHYALRVTLYNRETLFGQNR